MKRLEGKVAVITGGNSGIGLASAQRLAEEGARVAISGRNRKTLDQAAKIIGQNALAIQADTSKVADTEQLLKEVRQKLGKIDVLLSTQGLPNLLRLRTPRKLFLMNNSTPT